MNIQHIPTVSQIRSERAAMTLEAMKVWNEATHAMAKVILADSTAEIADIKAIMEARRLSDRLVDAYAPEVAI